MGGDKHGATDRDSDDKGWEHFVKVLHLSDTQRKALEGQKVTNIIRFHVAGEEEGYFNELRPVFSTIEMKFLRLAWTWIDLHETEIYSDDDKSSWFVKNFKESYIREASAAKQVAKAELEEKERKRHKTVQPNQGNASSFTANGSRTMQGVATLPPVFLKHLIPDQVKELFTNKFETAPSEEEKTEEEKKEEEIIRTLSDSFQCHGTPYNLKSVPETRSKDSALPSVHTQHLDFIAKQFEGQITTQRIFKDGLEKGDIRRTLAVIGLTDGIANSGSFPEAYFHTEPCVHVPTQDGFVSFVTTSIFECKDTSAAPDLGLGEGIANATNAAVAMAKVGIPSARIVVPVFITTGSLVQVGAVYMLEPSLPTVCFVTPKLDLSVEKDSEKAARILVAMAHHRKDVEDYVKSHGPTREDSVEMQLDPQKYHCKLLGDFFPCLGENCVGASLTHMLNVTSRLAGTSYACLPIAVRLKDRNLNHDAILFEALGSYSIGLPHDKKDRYALVSEMEANVSDMHEKKMVHVDLYLSNFMWKKEDDGSFSVRIIDFDSAHKMGEALTGATLARLHQIKSKFIRLGNTAIADHDNLYMEMLKENIDKESLRVAGTNENETQVKRRLDEACASFMEATFAASIWSLPLTNTK